MELRKRLMAIVGITALMMSMTAGIASAQVGDSGPVPASVDVVCSAPMTVEVTSGNIAFGTANLGPDQSANDFGAGTLDVEVDMGCYVGQWHVDASITAFTAPVPLGIFGADHFELRNAEVTEWALDPIEINACSPVVPGSDIEFTGFFNGDGGEVLGTASGSLLHLLCIPLGLNLDAGAPLVTKASYDPWLVDLNPLQPSGSYSAVFTLELYAD